MAARDDTPSGLPRPSPGEVPPRFGRFEVRGLVAEGGMGRVYRAFDPALGRLVALKVLTTVDPSHAERFLAEARAQARVEHEHVCKVFDVGEEAGVPYIAMQLVDGPTLQEERTALSLEEKVRIVKQVAEGIQAAHRTGLVHRDVKPANVLLERREDGGWHPYIADFGLARDPSSPGLTASGLVVGTPSYMAPEQAAGRHDGLDRRLDVYGLGVTLYEVLAYRLPFSGASGMEVMVNVLREEPVPLRSANPTIPEDLDTVVMKCLEKQPERRYQSARLLAEELERFLANEPVLAQRPTLAYRAAKWVRKNRAASVVAAGSLLVILAMLSFGVYNRWMMRERTALAQRLGAQVAEMEQSLRAASLLPLHDVTGERETVRSRLRGLEAEAGRLGRLGSGPAHYAVGRGHLALAEWPEARDRLTRAWQADFREPQVAWALGRALGALYQRGLVELSRLGSKELREARRAELVRELRDPALLYLRQAEHAAVGKPVWVEGLLALYEERYDEALALARRAYLDDPGFFEARRLEGDVLVLKGAERRLAGDYDGAMALYDEAGRAYAAAQEIARSDPGGYESDARRLVEVLYTGMRRGRWDPAAYEAGRAASAKARTANPASVAALVAEAHLEMRKGEWEWLHGEDPRASLGKAVGLTDAALRVRPSDTEALAVRGTALAFTGEAEKTRGIDPRATLRQAVESSEAALTLDPGLVAAANTVGNAHKAIAEWELSHGLDPSAAFARAIAAYGRAIAVSPNVTSPHNNVGLAHLGLARFAMARGESPAPELELAEQSLSRALALDPNNAYAHNNLGESAVLRAADALRRGEDPLPSADAAVASCDKAIGINAGFAEVHRLKADALRHRAQGLLRSGRSPEAALLEARASLEKARSINPQDLEIARAEAALELSVARWRESRGLTAGSERKRARAALDRFVAGKAIGGPAGAAPPDSARVNDPAAKELAAELGR